MSLFWTCRNDRGIRIQDRGSRCRCHFPSPDGLTKDRLDAVVFLYLQVDVLSPGDHGPDLQEIKLGFFSLLPVQIDGEFNLHMRAEGPVSDLEKILKQFGPRECTEFQNRCEGDDSGPRFGHGVFDGLILRGIGAGDEVEGTVLFGTFKIKLLITAQFVSIQFHCRISEIEGKKTVLGFPQEWSGDENGGVISG